MRASIRSAMLVAVGALLSESTLGATATSNAFLGPVRPMLFDLNPDDGIVHSIMIDAPQIPLAGRVALTEGGIESAANCPPVTFVECRVASGPSFAAATSTLEGGPLQLRLNLSGMAVVPDSSAAQQTGYVAELSYPEQWNFTISGNTHVQFVAEVSWSLAVSGQAEAGIRAQLALDLPGIGSFPGGSDEFDLRIGPGSAPASGSFTLSAELFNYTSMPLVAQLRMANLKLDGVAMASPVPEPSCFVLLACGVALVGFAAQRSRRRG